MINKISRFHQAQSPPNQALHLLIQERRTDCALVAFKAVTMSTHGFQRILSYCLARGKNAVKTEKQIEPPQDCLSTTVPFRRQTRQTERLMLRRACSYEMIEGLGEDAIVIHQGEALALNISSEGILLLMDQVPQVQQLIEIHTANSKKSHILTLFEVCWTRQIQSRTHDCQCLVGCRLSFGPSPHLLFKRKDVEHSVAHSLC